MGMVFTPEQIASGDYPESTEAHIRAARFLLAGVVELNAARPRNEQITALGYGSVALGGHNRRSDLDFMAILPDEQEYSDGLAVADLVAKAKATENVPIEPEILSRTAARRGTHTRDSLFAEHLGAMAQQSPLIVGDPSLYFPFAGQRFSSLDSQIAAVEGSVWSYIERKKGHFARGLSGDDSAPTVTLQRAFELPGSLARKLIRLAQLTQLQKNGSWDTELLPHTVTASRAEMTAAAAAIGGEAWRSDSAWLTIRNDEYTDVLESTIAEEVSPAAYSQWLHSVAPETLQRAYRLAVVGGNVFRQL